MVEGMGRLISAEARKTSAVVPDAGLSRPRG